MLLRRRGILETPVAKPYNRRSGIHVMCGRYRLSRRKQLIQEYFDTAEGVDWEPRYNSAHVRGFDEGQGPLLDPSCVHNTHSVWEGARSWRRFRPDALGNPAGLKTLCQVPRKVIGPTPSPLPVHRYRQSRRRRTRLPQSHRLHPSQLGADSSVQGVSVARCNFCAPQLLLSCNCSE